MGRFPEGDWYLVRATDSHGLTVDLEVRIIVEHEKPQVTLKNTNTEKTTIYITEGLRYFFFLPDPLIYNRDFS